jgi:AraC-like DNA-binding protein
MDREFRRNPPLAEVASAAGLSPVYFHRRFTRAFAGLTPHDYMEQKRMRQAREQIAQTRLPISDIAEAAGYDNPFYFSRRFKALCGASPRQFRDRHSPSGP